MLPPQTVPLSSVPAGTLCLTSSNEWLLATDVAGGVVDVGTGHYFIADPSTQVYAFPNASISIS